MALALLVTPLVAALEVDSGYGLERKHVVRTTFLFLGHH
jgi:hypothetical protein